MSERGDFWRRFRRNRAAAAGLLVLVAVVAMALLAPAIYPASPLRMAGAPFLWPGQDPAFPLGTDVLGRDLAAGLFHGARISLLVGFVATLMSILVGITIGCVAGYRGGWVDDALMRLTELFQTMPHFMFIMMIIAFLGPRVENVVVSIGLVSWPPVARLVRAEFLSLRQREFVLACHGIGMSAARIVMTQMLPNALPPVIVLSSVMVATAILIESALSFLGFSDANVMTWGTMIGLGRDVLRQAWYISAIPGVAILLVVLALNLVGEGVNDALNPRLKDRG